MQQWVKNQLVQDDTRPIRASVVTYGGGGQLTHTIIASSIWVKVKNGQWIRRSLVKAIGAQFKGAEVVFLGDAVLLYGERFSYRFKTYPKRRLTTSKGKEKDEPK